MAYSGNQPLPGLHPVGNVAGTAPSVHEYVVSATYATTIAEGSIALKDALGANMAAATGTAAYGGLMGVFAHNVAATPGAGATVLIYDDPNQVYIGVQDGTMTTTVAIEAIGQYVGCVSNTYNATLGQSKLLLDTSTLTSVPTVAINLQIIGYAQNIGDVMTSANSQLKVRFAAQSHIYSSQNGTNTRITA